MPDAPEKVAKFETQLGPKQLAAVAAILRDGRKPVEKPAHFREICDVDIAALAQRVASIPGAEWDAENATKENDFACFHHTSHIVARFSSGGLGPETYHATEFWSRWAATLTPLLMEVAAHYRLAEPDFSKVMLARLAAKGRIDPHRDVGTTNHLTHKIHIPLITNDKVWFRVGAEKFQLAAGKAYELNNIKLHGVVNGGGADRIHLIFELFDRAAV